MQIHRQGEAKAFDDEYVLAIGLSGQIDGQSHELIIQCSKEISDQDTELGHDAAYVEFNGEGGYGLIQELRLQQGKFIDISFVPEKLSAMGLNWPAFRFELSQAVESDLLKKFERGSQIGRFSFSQS